MNLPPENNSTPLSIYPWQQNAWDGLQQRINNDQLAHGLLLQGVPDSGLDIFAQVFANFMLCNSPINFHACGRCRDCMLLNAGTHPGLIKVTPTESDEGKVSKVIKIDQIREIIDFATHTSMQPGKKIILIYPAETMNQNAANALLKSLEEPPSNTQFLLVTNMPGKLMPTIRSRCQKIDLPLPGVQEADVWLSTYVSNSQERLQLLALSAGNPLLVCQWLQNSATKEIFELRKDLSSLLMGTISPLIVAKNWLGNGGQRLNWWWRWLLLEAKHSFQQAPVVPTPELLLTQDQLVGFMQKLLVAKRQLESSANPNEQLLLESLLIDWHNLKSF